MGDRFFKNESGVVVAAMVRNDKALCVDRKAESSFLMVIFFITKNSKMYEKMS